MTKQLVSVENGRVTFGEAVGRVADSLSPLGAIARIIAESTACAVAIQEIQLAGRTVEAQATLRLAELENRRRAASASLRQLRTQAGGAELTAHDFRRCIVNMQQAIVRPQVSLAEKKTYLELIRALTTGLLSHHSQQGDQLIGVIDVVLNGPGAGRTSTVALDGPVNRPTPARRRRR